MFTKIEDKNCKVIVDNGCINTVASKVTEKLRWKVVPHPHPYKVSCINSTILGVKQQCLVLIDFNLFKDKIWGDVVTIDIGQVILSRSWLFDKDVTIYVT